MNHKTHLTNEDCLARASNLVTFDMALLQGLAREHGCVRLYGIPRGGIPAAYLVARWLTFHGIRFEFVDSEQDATYIVDDVIDSGTTAKAFRDMGYPPVHALVDKTDVDHDIGWVVFPWELDDETLGPAHNVRRLLQLIEGDQSLRPGLLETPARVIKSYGELFAGYGQTAADIIKVFDEDMDVDEMVLMRKIEFQSTCEHHMVPFVGHATIAYLPEGGRVIGASKIARILDMYAKRLQIQERLTQQVVNALMESLTPLGVACQIVAKHYCMVCRGVNKQHSEMVTNSLAGAFRDDPATRAEFMLLAQG